MNLIKILPKKLKYYIKKKFRIPSNTYQNVHTTIRVNHYHSGEFNKFHNKFCQNDLQLKNNDITRFRNYMNYSITKSIYYLIILSINSLKKNLY